MPPTPTTSGAGSLWLTSVDQTAYPRLDEDLTVDLAVIGGGIAGLTTALLLKRQGASVAVIEALRVGRGVTGWPTARVTALQSTIYSPIRSRKGADAAAPYAAASVAAVERVATIA